MSVEFVFDFDRAHRTGIEEAVLCSGKSVAQIAAILQAVRERSARVLLTRLSGQQAAELVDGFDLDYDEVSRTAFFGDVPERTGSAEVGIVPAGTSDVPVAREAERTLRYYGVGARSYLDIGVAGLWRLGRWLSELESHRVIIVVAGMDGALPSVIGGLLGGLVIAVPVSTGYGMSRNGETALHAALASCAPGVVVVNIDNGYGAAIAALRALGATGRSVGNRDEA